MYYSSSSSPNGPLRVMKVFYREIAHASEILKEPSQLHEELNLPCTAIKELRNVLKHSNNLLPASLRHFQDWKVGLIEKYNFYEGPSFMCLNVQ